jgi:hypothetical protein
MYVMNIHGLNLSFQALVVFLSFSVTQSHSLPLADIHNLAQSEKWKALLHYRPQGLSRDIYSEVDDERFFYAKNGSTSPKDELLETIKAMQLEQASDQAASCRFPARLKFIQKHFPQLNLQQGDCVAFNDWKSKIKGHSLSLIFPASYINSPSSMFGHTLLRLDGEQGHDLLSSAINFAAYTDPSDDEITFTIKGLTGGYPGYVSLVPYYEKVNEYNHIESRDIWEYKLNLSQLEIDEFIRHIWELNEIRFDYYFIDENCSYRLLTMLEAVNPDWVLSKRFDYRVVPTDTIRSLKDAGLIGEIHFRPSKTTHIAYQRQTLDEQLRSIARQIADDPNTVSNQDAYLELTEKEKAQVLELAYQYNRYLDVIKKMKDKTLHGRSLKLLSLRSKVNYKGKPFSDTPAPDVRDEQGHNTFRSLVSTGYTHETPYVELGMRINYHDLLDSISGYRQGSQIEMGNVRLRADDENLQLQHFDVLSIRSLGPRNRFSHPISWQVLGGYERWASDGLSHNYLRVGAGAAVKAGPGLFYGLGNIEMAYGARYDHNWRVAIAPEIGMLIQKQQFSLLSSVRYGASLDENAQSYELNVGGSYRVSTHQQLRAEWIAQSWDGRSEQDLRLSYVLYH